MKWIDTEGLEHELRYWHGTTGRAGTAEDILQALDANPEAKEKVRNTLLVREALEILKPAPVSPDALESAQRRIALRVNAVAMLIELEERITRNFERPDFDKWRTLQEAKELGRIRAARKILEAREYE